MDSKLAIPALLFLILASGCSQQEGTLVIGVYERTGEGVTAPLPISGAQINIVNSATEKEYFLTTSDLGEASIVLEPALYYLTASKEGYQPVEQEVKVAAGVNPVTIEMSAETMCGNGVCESG